MLLQLNKMVEEEIKGLVANVLCLYDHNRRAQLSLFKKNASYALIINTRKYFSTKSYFVKYKQIKQHLISSPTIGHIK